MGRHGEAQGERQEFREEIWEERLSATAKAADINLGGLGARKSDPAKVLLAAVMKASTAVSNGWLSARLGMGQPASVSQYVRRFHQLGGAKDRRYRRALSITET